MYGRRRQRHPDRLGRSLDLPPSLTLDMAAKKQRKPAERPAEQASPAEEHPHVYVSPVWRVVVHVWVAFHLVAVVAPPMGAPVPQLMYRATRPYIDLLYLDHGYAFFAPQVGANHLVEYRVEFEDEREPVVGRFPDLDDQWPRLLYHRHFMLGEFLHNNHVPPGMTAADFPSEEAFLRWQAQREMYGRLRDSMANHLRHEYDAARVTLTRIEHRQPLAPDFQDGMRLDDDRLYRRLPDGIDFGPMPPPGGPLPGPYAPPPQPPIPYAPEPSP